uniref:Uncharacterized protein n=1 Tax=Nelumbo nucifera TaxID=4432 RepID=A0A822XSQ8_NELNU|nr:TPA_asm: hypothetical protein HUJ06_023664 [Nelumbo nucifera]
MKHEQIGQDHITSNNSRASESAGGDDQFIHFRFGSYYFQLQKMRLWLPWTSCILFLVQNLVELTSGVSMPIILPRLSVICKLQNFNHYCILNQL